MKITQILAIFSLILVLGCNPKMKQTNHFTSKSDTLVLKTEKIKGFGMFLGVGGNIGFCDTSEYYKYPVIFPKNITDIKFSHEIIDFKKFDIDDYQNKKSWNNPILKDNSICLMSGTKGNQSILIVDENNNKDFRDDSIRLVQDYDWNRPAKYIKIKYKIFNGIEMSEDSSWATIRTRPNNEFIFFVSHHLVSNFSVDNQQYQIGVVDFRSGFCFNEPIIALTGQNGIKKDTLLKMDLLKKNEFLKLKDTYYRLDSVSNDGKFVTLVKESDFNSKIGTQVGMIASDFNSKTIDGDSIRFRDYKGKYLLIINVSACYSKESSYKCYKDLTEAYHGKLEFLCIDKSPVFLNNSIKELKLTGNFVDANENKMIQAYRPEFCSRTCFLINPEGRIIDKFEIFDWKTNLPTNYYTSNDGTALKTEEQVRLEYQTQFKWLKKLHPEMNSKPVIYHKEFRKDSVINYFAFSSESGDTIVLPEFKFVYRQDPVFMYLNKKLPDFILKDTNGIEFKSTQLLGKPTLLNFSGKYCGSCVAEIPHLNQLKKIYGDRVNFVSIADVERRPGGLKSYLQLYTSFQFRILENTVENKKALIIPSMPRNIFLDKDGIVRNIQRSCNYTSSDAKDNYFMKIIDELLGSSR